MKSATLLILALFQTLTLVGQLVEGNQHLIDAVKTKETKENIEKWLVGYWKFIELRTPEGNRVDTLYLGLDNAIFEVVSRTDYLFQANGTYAANNTLSDSKAVSPDSSNGTWYYDQAAKELKLVYHKPMFPEFLKSSDPAIEELKERGILKPQSGYFIEINKITKDELFLIEHEAHNNNELKYNLLYYKKQ